MDISGLGIVTAASRGSDAPLLNPFTNQPTGIVFTVLGADAPEVTAASRRFQGTAMLGRSRRNTESPDDAAELTRKSLIAQADAAITGLAAHSEPLQFGDETVKVPSPRFSALLKDPDFFFIALQMVTHSNSRGNYAPEVSNDSSSGQDTSGS